MPIMTEIKIMITIAAISIGFDDNDSNEKAFELE